MQSVDLMAIINKIQHFQCEFQNIEVKAAAQGTPTRLYDTLSSFSNQSEGGILIFGLDEREDFKVVGVYDAQDLQHKVAEQCKQMEPEVRPLFSVVEIDQKTVVSAEIPGVDISERPVFYKGVGRQKGSYVRVGEADEPMNEYEIYIYEVYRRRIRDDLRVVEGAKMTALDSEQLKNFLNMVKCSREPLSSNFEDIEILEMMGVVEDEIPTLAGVMALGKYPQMYFPQLSITAVVVAGTQMGELGQNDERFIANQRFTGNISQMLEGAVNFVKRNCRKQTIILPDGTRADRMEFPIKAVREVVLNALVHRDYSIHTEGSPITICMFYDRMEITNKGGLYGRITTDQLGKVRPDTRNTALMNILEDLGISENRYSGIPTIRREMERQNLPEPEFVSQRGEFTVILRNSLSGEGIKEPGNTEVENPSIKSREELLLEYCKTPRSRQEMSEYLGLSQYYTLDKYVYPMVEAGKLALSVPEKLKSSKQRFYAV